jgi:hypothetical protein
MSTSIGRKEESGLPSGLHILEDPIDDNWVRIQIDSNGSEFSFSWPREEIPRLARDLLNYHRAQEPEPVYRTTYPEVGELDAPAYGKMLWKGAGWQVTLRPNPEILEYKGYGLDMTWKDVNGILQNGFREIASWSSMTELNHSLGEDSDTILTLGLPCKWTEFRGMNGWIPIAVKISYDPESASGLLKSIDLYKGEYRFGVDDGEQPMNRQFAYLVNDFLQHSIIAEEKWKDEWITMYINVRQEG